MWAYGLFGASLALRMIHVLTLHDSPFFSILYIDPLMYDEWAQRIASGQLLSERPFFLDPLYPYFIAVVYAIFGHSFLALAFVQAVLGALVPPLVYTAARRPFDEATARTAGVIACVYLPSVYFGNLVMKPGLTLVLMAVWMALMARLLQPESRARTAFAAGVVLALACLTRGNLLLIVPIVAIWMLLGSSDDRSSLRFVERIADPRRLSRAATLAAGVAVVLLLPLAHNYRAGGELILTTANSGANFYIGNNPANKTGEYQQLPFIRANPKWEQVDFAAEARRRAGGREMTDREISDFWFAETWRWVGEHPEDWVWLLGRKVRAFWGSWEIPDSLDYYLYREYTPVLRLPIPGFGLLAPLALTGAFLAWRRRGWPRLMLWAILVYSLSVIVFFVFSRFRMAIAPALFVFAGYALVEGKRRIVAARRNELRPLAAMAAVFLAAFVFVNIPVRARTDSLGFRVAETIGLPTRPETSALGHYNLGLAYAKLAKSQDEAANLQKAEKEMRTALDLSRDLTHARIHVELGKVLSRQRKNREAIEIYKSGLPLEPGEHDIHVALGRLYRREGEIEAAVAEFQRALQMQPRCRIATKNMAEILTELGRVEEARQAYAYLARLHEDL
jgi:tetratricopeptide (TPR) repeat protein